MNKQEKLIWNKLKNEYADNTEVLDVLCGGENAREKQIPKKPKVMETTLVGEKFWWYCGHCGASRHTGSKANYCGYCGGKVDWRNYDE